MEIYYATTNKAKVQSMMQVMHKYGIKIMQAEIKLPEPRHDDVEPIVKSKAAHAYEILQKPVVALDAGLYIPSLAGFPKAFVNLALTTIGLEGILRLVEGKERHCYFEHCTAYMDSQLPEPITFKAQVKGRLAYTIRGNGKHGWSKLGYIFIPEGSDKTLAEMNEEEKAAWTEKHRQDSESEQLAKWIKVNRK